MKRIASFVFVLLMLVNYNVISQDLDSLDANYQASWIARVGYAKLKLNKPKDFSVLKGAYLQNAGWECGKLGKYYFQRVLIKSDSSVVIALDIITNYKTVTPSGHTIDSKTDWITNAKNVYSFMADISKAREELDPKLLKSLWNADYGVSFTPKKFKNVPFLNVYNNNRALLFANGFSQVFIVYFYKDNMKQSIEKVILETRNVLAKK